MGEKKYLFSRAETYNLIEYSILKQLLNKFFRCFFAK